MFQHQVFAFDGIGQSIDVFSLLHFPLLCGLIIYAFAIEESMLHPDEEISFPARMALALGIFIF
ncbi:MAG: hypothetical protein ABIQ11_09855, partial [Saprospiraceae bacterium]